MIVGWLDCHCVVRVPPDDLWRTFGKESCVTKEQFDAYYDGRPIAVGIVFHSFHPLKEMASLAQIGLKMPPQSWRWIDAPSLE